MARLQQLHDLMSANNDSLAALDESIRTKSSLLATYSSGSPISMDIDQPPAGPLTTYNNATAPQILPEVMAVLAAQGLTPSRLGLDGATPPRKGPKVSPVQRLAESQLSVRQDVYVPKSHSQQNPGRSPQKLQSSVGAGNMSRGHLQGRETLSDKAFDSTLYTATVKTVQPKQPMSTLKVRPRSKARLNRQHTTIPTGEDSGPAALPKDTPSIASGALREPPPLDNLRRITSRRKHPDNALDAQNQRQPQLPQTAQKFRPPESDSKTEQLNYVMLQSLATSRNNEEAMPPYPAIEKQTTMKDYDCGDDFEIVEKTVAAEEIRTDSTDRDHTVVSYQTGSLLAEQAKQPGLSTVRLPGTSDTIALPQTEAVDYMLTHARNKFDSLDSGKIGSLGGEEMLQMASWCWDSFHPGGVELTQVQRTIESARLVANMEGTQCHRLTFNDFAIWFKRSANKIYHLRSTSKSENIDQVSHGLQKYTADCEESDARRDQYPQAVEANLLETQYEEEFKRFDRGAKGFLDEADVGVLMDSLNYDTDEAYNRDLIASFGRFDVDGSGKIESKEFDKLWEHFSLASDTLAAESNADTRPVTQAVDDARRDQYPQAVEANLLETQYEEEFKRFDRGAKGFLDEADVGVLMDSLNYDTDEAYNRDLIASFGRFDVDGSGKIESKEFDKLWEHFSLASDTLAAESNADTSSQLLPDVASHQNQSSNTASSLSALDKQPATPSPIAKLRRAGTAVIATQRMDQKVAAAAMAVNEARALAEVARQEKEHAEANAAQLQEVLVADPSKKAAMEMQQAKKELQVAIKEEKKALKKVEKEDKAFQKAQSRADKKSKSAQSPTKDKIYRPLTPGSPRVAPPPGVLLPLMRGLKVLVYERLSEKEVVKAQKSTAQTNAKANSLKQNRKNAKSEEKKMRKELKKLSVGELRKQCSDGNILPDLIEQARDSDNPKTSLIDLLVNHKHASAELSKDTFTAEIEYAETSVAGSHQDSRPAAQTLNYQVTERLLCIDFDNFQIKWKKPQEQKFDKSCTFPISSLIDCVHGPSWNKRAIEAARATTKGHLSLFGQHLPDNAQPWQLFSLFFSGKKGGTFDFSAASHRAVTKVLLALEHCSCIESGRQPQLRWGGLLWGIIRTRVRFRAMQEGTTVASIIAIALSQAQRSLSTSDQTKSQYAIDLAEKTVGSAMESGLSWSELTPAQVAAAELLDFDAETWDAVSDEDEVEAENRQDHFLEASDRTQPYTDQQEHQSADAAELDAAEEAVGSAMESGLSWSELTPAQVAAAELLDFDAETWDAVSDEDEVEAENRQDHFLEASDRTQPYTDQQEHQSADAAELDAAEEAVGSAMESGLSWSELTPAQVAAAELLDFDAETWDAVSDEGEVEEARGDVAIPTGGAVQHLQNLALQKAASRAPQSTATPMKLHSNGDINI